MQRCKAQHINDMLLLFLHDNGLETPLLQHRLVQLWPEVVGTDIAQRSEALEIRSEVLWVRVNSPALASDLQMRRTELVLSLNARAGAILIRDIRFVV